MAALVALVVGLPVAGNAWMMKDDRRGAVHLAAPGALGEWRPVNAHMTSWKPAYPSPYAAVRATYTTGGKSVGLYIQYYRNQGHGSKLISSDNALVRNDDERWQQTRTGVRDIQIAGQPVRVDTAVLQDSRGTTGLSDQRWIVWRWFWIDGHVTSNSYWAKLWTAWAQIRGRGDDSAAVILIAPADDEKDANAALASFAGAAGNAIDAMLKSAQAQP
jgi:EpsI family protein